MPITNGIWHPKMFNKQALVYNNYSRALLVSGPRYSGKTVIVLKKIIRHLWETPDARVAMFTKTRALSMMGGAWQDIHDIIIPEWVEADIGFNYTTRDYYDVPGPKVDGATRTPFFKVTNCHGGESTMYLFSLEHESEVSAKVKEKRFSLIYFSELDKFYEKDIFTVTTPSLRMPHLSYDEHQWIADCNPSEEGEQSWIYKMWYVMRVQTYDEHVEACKEYEGVPMDKDLFEQIKSGLGLIELFPEDNPYLDPRQLAELKFNCQGDVGFYARHVLGKWVYGDGDSSRHFRGFFKPNLHVIGNCDSADEKNWETAVPSPQCIELPTGWDLGDVNHASVIAEKQMIDIPDKRTGKTVKRSHFTILDELVKIKDEVQIEEFTEEFMTILEGGGDREASGLLGLEQLSNVKFNLERAWSDTSSIDKFNATSGTFPRDQVFSASGGRIWLQGADKVRGAPRVRVMLLKRLLSQGRIIVSAHCFFTIRMLNDLKKGKDRLNFVVPDENKHVFDALTYMLYMECKDELQSETPGETGRRSLVVTNVS